MKKGPQWYQDTPGDRRRRVAELYAKGLKNIVIAKRLGISDVTVSQDLLALGLRKPRPAPVTAHSLAKLDTIGLQALFLDGLSPQARGKMTGGSAAFTFAELSRDQLINAILRQRETPAPAYPRVPAAGSAPATPPVGGAPARAGGGPSVAVAARPAPVRRAS